MTWHKKWHCVICAPASSAVQDLSPKYASALLGITNTAGAIPGVLGVTSAGYLLDATSSWQLALFYPTAAFQLLGAVFYGIFASSERQHWS
jgi:ACS family sodium-dependent inorganic phosphate cotransporter